MELAAQSNTDIMSVDDKLKIFYASDEDLKDNPLNYRLHQPHKYNHYCKFEDFLSILFKCHI